MKINKKEIIYCGIWNGVGKIFNIRVGNGYTTIIVKPGEDVRARFRETREKFQPLRTSAQSE